MLSRNQPEKLQVAFSVVASSGSFAKNESKIRQKFQLQLGTPMKLEYFKLPPWRENSVLRSVVRNKKFDMAGETLLGFKKKVSVYPI